MKEYVIRVRLPNGMLTEVRVVAQSPGIALEQVRAQYGPGSAQGILASHYL